MQTLFFKKKPKIIVLSPIFLNLIYQLLWLNVRVRIKDKG